MHNHHHVHARAVEQREASPEYSTQPNGRVVSVVYVTSEPKFTGGVIGGGGSGDSDDDSSTSNRARPTSLGLNPQVPTTTIRDDSDDSADTTSAPNQNGITSARHSSPTVAPQTSSRNGALITASTTFGAMTTTFATSTTSPRTTSAVSGGSSSDNSGSSDSSAGMSLGAKIGIVAAVVLGIGLVLIIALVCMRKKRKQREQTAKAQEHQFQQEKAAAAAAAAVKVAKSPNAPRLSLRPMSRLAPELMGDRSKSRLSQSTVLSPVSESGNTYTNSRLSPSASVSTRSTPHTQANPFNDPVNPFADPEKAAAAAAAASAAVSRLPMPSQQQEMYGANTTLHPEAHELEDTRSIIAPAASSTPQPQQGPYSPAQSSAQLPAPIGVGAFPGAPSPAVATGPGPEVPPGNVYRIMMDFKPTMEDELELRAGQLVRLLHEYDDGWALCIRLDRSQQGVVPRTCLAAKPSKPRPAPGARSNGPPSVRSMTPSSQSPRMHGPPSAPGSPLMHNNPRQGTPQSQRPYSPAGPPQQSRPYSPAGPPQQQRPYSPAGQPRNGPPSSPPGAFNQAPRPLSPGPRPQASSMSPISPDGGSQRERSELSGEGVGYDQRSPAPRPSNLGPGAPPARTNSPGVAM